jgi:hypothetical protein
MSAAAVSGIAPYVRALAANNQPLGGAATFQPQA